MTSPGETTRIAGFRHAVLHARATYRLLHAGKLGPAIHEWGAARAHHAFITGLCEPLRDTFAGNLLRRALIHLGQQVEAAVSPRPQVMGWAVAEPIVEAFADLADDHPDHAINADDITDRAARAASDLVRRYVLTERP